MAERQSFLLLSLSVLVLIISSCSVDARPGVHFHPCNTFVVSTYSFSFLPRNPNSLDDFQPHLSRHHRPEFFAVVSDFRQFDVSKPNLFVDLTQIPARNQKLFLDGEDAQVDDSLLHHHELPLGVSSSFYDRTMDILNVVASLLFGAACGALTAGTMYFIWSLFNNRHGHDAYHGLDGFSSDDGDDDDDDIFNPKKPAGGYVVVSAGPPEVAKDPAPAPPKETA